ncbi:hypothetical protein [Actinoplanes rectilineatus]|uniref:hypothetical protein n=1 Tax=Actinoplanes rectilineatus TaxID=113571 RepID=UPI0005F2CA28|nr:hypothetical protein [Actinoplanes rectilineatus]
MAQTTHPSNCEKARQHRCDCACSGARHGWGGWIGYARGPERDRADRREQLLAGITRNRHNKIGFNRQNREGYIDLARLEISGRLSPDTTGDRTPRIVDLGDPRSRAMPLNRLETLADTLLEKTWAETSKEIDKQAGDQAREVKRRLAKHTWCGILVILIRGLEEVHDVAAFVADRAKKLIAEFVTSKLSSLARTLAEAVVGIVVDKVGSALGRLVEAHFPLLGEDTLRVLRMLALFVCPSVDRHADVYRYAVQPLTAEGTTFLIAETRDQVTALFTEWWARTDPGSEGGAWQRA